MVTAQECADLAQRLGWPAAIVACVAILGVVLLLWALIRA